jgi:hypothetical protein
MVEIVLLFLLYCISFACTAKLMLEQVLLFAQVVRWEAVIPQI